jgi:hypothetical protein
MSWVAATFATAVVGAGLSYSSGRAQSGALKQQAANQELEAKVAEIGVKQTAARQMEGLLTDLGAIRARRATQNVSADSASAIAAEKGFERDYMRNLRTDILQQRYGIQARISNASGLRAGANAAMLSGYANAVSSIAGSFASFGGGNPGSGGGGGGGGSGGS